MIVKLSIEEFRQIKSELASVLKQYEELSNNEYEDIDVDEKQQILVEQYFKQEELLLSYDLSDIPFEEWEGMQLTHDGVLDFSNTNANIDFNLVKVYGNCNFKGCNIRNLDMALEGLTIDPKFFDDEIIINNPTIFLSDLFTEEFKEKFYENKLVIADIVGLSFDKIQELKEKHVELHFDNRDSERLLYKTIGLDKIIELYNYSKEDYELVCKLIQERLYSDYIVSNSLISYEEFIEQLKNANVANMKEICYSYARNRILYSKFGEINIEKLPELFVRENSDIFLIDPLIPEDLRKRYYSKKLTFEDIVNNIDLFDNIPIEYWIKGSNSVYDAVRGNNSDAVFKKIKSDDLKKLIKKYPAFFNHLVESNNIFKFVKSFSKTYDNLEIEFLNEVKEYFLSVWQTNYIYDQNGTKKYILPEWILPFNFSVVDEIKTKEDLMNYDNSMIVLDLRQQRFINKLGIDNIKRLDRETEIFTHKAQVSTTETLLFHMFVSFYSLGKNKIEFKNNLSYDEFVVEFSKFMDYARSKNLFTDYPDYDWIEGEFRDKHPEIFIDKNAPDELKRAFYRNNITPQFLFEHKEYIPYLYDKNLVNTIYAEIIYRDSEPKKVKEAFGNFTNFIEVYVSLYGNEKLLHLIAKYGNVLSKIGIDDYENAIKSEEAIEKLLRKSIYKKIIESNVDYEYLEQVSDFVTEYPDIFVDFDSLTSISPQLKHELKKDFYGGRFDFNTIKRHPELIEFLKEKNLNIPFRNKRKGPTNNWYTVNNKIKTHSDLELLDVFGNEKLLQLCAKYGRYMNDVNHYLSFEFIIVDGKYVDTNNNEVSFEKITDEIEGYITQGSLSGNMQYDPTDAPDFLKNQHPELFLDEDAPEDLKACFYNYGNNHPMTFVVLSTNKHWFKWLEGKSLVTALLRGSDSRESMHLYFDCFGEETGIKLGVSRAETVTHMISSNQVELMKSWYDKTGQRFIPDFVVMQNIPLEEADKFLTSGSNWSNLMKIKSFARTPESRDAMLKLAYSFGAFDGDQVGFKKLKELLTDIPRNIPRPISTEFVFFDEKLRLSSNSYDIELYSKLKNVLKEEGYNLDENKSVIKQIYRYNQDVTYTLTINPQSYPRSTELLRILLERRFPGMVLTPEKAHQLFGGFILKYDPDFREFLLANMKQIMSSPETTKYVSSVQKHFKEIKALNSNRILTWNLAVSYVQSNKYSNVEIGNEGVAEISSIAGYSQSDFDTLQQIYNYGKQRTFSSIPRISKVEEEYTYEMLRLDDPLAMAIGTLTDCCQELGNVAEVCMEHSMVDKNGRVFIIKDKDGNIIAQSWVWRNKDVLCFDNIEIPDKVFDRVGKIIGREKIAQIVFDLYKKAAHELIEEDEKIYKQLLEDGKITQEQYDGLRLGKVTVGLGYNDIASVLKTNLSIDNSVLSRPLSFEQPVELSRGLYTSDSNTQYIIEEREDRKEYNGDTLTLHSDDFIEYTDETFTEKKLLALQKLELVTKGNASYLETELSEYYDNSQIVTSLANNYYLNPETTRIVMNPNFAIIYDVNGNKLKIADLLFNAIVKDGQQQLDIENKVIIQIRLALNQITNGKEVDVSDLDDKQKEMYNKAINLTDELDIERGIGHAR